MFRACGTLFLWLALLVGCGQLEVGIETTATPEPTATIIAVADVVTATIPPTTMTPTLKPTKLATAVSTATPTPTLTVTHPPTTTPTKLPLPPATQTAVATATTDPLPVIHHFTVVPQTVAPGETLRLNWEATGEYAEICVFQTGYGWYRECRQTAVSGALSWELDDLLQDDFAVELTVYQGEQQAGQGWPVQVICLDEATWWFFTPAPVNCPAAAAVTTSAAYQPFEHGWMLWLADSDVIYAFFDDNSFAQFYGYQLWGDVESGDGGIVAPQGYKAPVRGFGLVWRGEADGAAGGWVRDKLGWGLTSESGFQSQYQEDDYLNFSGIYVRDPAGRIIYLDPSLSSWSVYIQSE
ncbi:MAG: hypothetical protein IAF02_04270 [Anaerolineae bacterium]|nr:hypothetical protein [Anaerolineae bacterium]